MEKIQARVQVSEELQAMEMVAVMAKETPKKSLTLEINNKSNQPIKNKWRRNIK